MHDTPGSRARCFSSVQCVRAAHSRRAPRSASVLVGPSASRRIPLAVRSNALLWGLGQNRQPLLWAHRQYLRLGARPLEVGFGCGWGLLSSSSWTSASGTIPATASSPRAYPHSIPVRSSPLHSRKSAHQNRLALPQEDRTHRERHHHVPGHCQLLTGARSLTDLRFVGESISGLITNLTLIPVRDVPTVFVSAAFWLSLRPRPIRSRDGGTKAEELSGQRVRIPLSAVTQGGAGSLRGACTFMPRFLLQHVIFDHGLIDGLGPDQPRQEGNLLCRKDWIQLRRISLSEWVILPVQEVAAYPWCAECEHLRSLPRGAPGQVGSRRLVAVASVRKQDRWSLYGMSGQLQRLRTRVVGPRRGWGLLPECA